MTAYVYLHGFNSGPQSLKARETRSWLELHAPSVDWYCPQLSPHPEEAIQQARQLIESLPADTLLIGSSLGGYYACWLAHTLDRKAVLINPAMLPHLDLKQFAAELHDSCTDETSTLTRKDLDALMALHIEQPDPARYWVILGSRDEVLDWRAAARYFLGSRQTVFNGDNHRLARWPECLPHLADFAAGSSSSGA